MTSTPLTFRVRSTEDLIAVAPIVLGFHPADDVVMMTAAGDHLFHGRTDLPRSDEAAPGVAEAVAEQLLAPARRNGIRAVVFLFFSDDERRVRQVWGALRRGCARSRMRVVTAVRVDAGRYYPLVGPRRDRETGIGFDVSSHPFVAEAVLRGLVVEKDRAALVATAAADPAAVDATQAALDRDHLVATGPPTTGTDRRRWGDWLEHTVRGHVEGGTSPATPELARIVWAAQDVRVRDAAWSLVRRADAERHEAFWLDVVRRTPDRFLAAPASLLGWAAWQAGHGALAWIAVDRCQEVDPAYTMAELLGRLLHQAVPPDAFESGFAWDEGLPA